jgi:hypothetical protein
MSDQLRDAASEGQAAGDPAGSARAIRRLRASGLENPGEHGPPRRRLSSSEAPVGLGLRGEAAGCGDKKCRTINLMGSMPIALAAFLERPQADGQIGAVDGNVPSHPGCGKREMLGGG